MVVDDFSDADLQKMRFYFKKVGVFAKFFEGSLQENINYINNVTQAPVLYVKDMEPEFLLFLFVKYGYDGLSSRIGVSKPFLKKNLPKLVEDQCVNLTCDDVFRHLSKIEVEVLLSKVDNYSIIEAISGWKRSRIVKHFGKVCTISDKGHMQSSKGRKAELFFKDVRGDMVESDGNDDKGGRNPDYDILDRVYGKVNVKGAKAHVLKDGEIVWYFSLKQKPDWFACIGYDINFQDPVFIRMIKLGEEKNLRISAKNIEESEMLYICSRVSQVPSQKENPYF